MNNLRISLNDKIMQDLMNTYGYCVIPKNTLLFRGQTDLSYDDCMMFSTKHWVAGVNNNTIEVWKTKRDIKILFLVGYLNDNSWTTSALPQLLNNILPVEDSSNFDIKQVDVKKRNLLVQKLFNDHGIDGWLTSLENRVELEVCLFDKETNTNQLELVDTVDKKSKTYYKDSLDEINVFPSKGFYEKTNEKLAEQSPNLSTAKDHSENYKNMMDSWVGHAIPHYGMNNDEAKHYLFNLRSKLNL